MRDNFEEEKEEYSKKDNERKKAQHDNLGDIEKEQLRKNEKGAFKKRGQEKKKRKV